jgi:DNA-binding NarL/FixJ family response regulator
MQAPPINKVILIDDHAVVRSGLRRLLEINKSIEVIAEGNSGEQAYQLYVDLRPDMVVMDLSMPGMGGLESAKRILARYPEAKIIMFSMHDTAAFASQALKAGVRGYVTKAGAADDLVQAVQDVAQGKTFMTADIAQKVALLALLGDNNPMHLLSAREFEVFRLLAEGMRIEEIALTLKISQKTVANYYTLLKQKLNINSPVELVRLAMKHGLIENQ